MRLIFGKASSIRPIIRHALTYETKSFKAFTTEFNTTILEEPRNADKEIISLLLAHIPSLLNLILSK